MQKKKTQKEKDDEDFLIPEKWVLQHLLIYITSE